MKIISSAPARVSLAGGGTDLLTFSEKYTGAVMNFTINLYCHVKLFTDEDTLLNYEHKIPKGCDPKLLQVILEHYNLKKCRVESSFDGEIGSGLGSSSAFTVALIGAINKIFDLKLEKYALAETAYDLESNKAKHTCGRQDAFASSFGGFNVFTFNHATNIVSLTRDWLDQLLPSLVLIYTGQKREKKDLQDNLNELTPLKIRTLQKMKDLVLSGVKLLEKHDVAGFGELLDLSWQLKKSSSEGASNKKIDVIYEYAKTSGAYGGKLLGAGGGGYMLFVVEPFRRGDFCDRMEKYGMKVIDFQPVYDGLNCRIL